MWEALTYSVSATMQVDITADTLIQVDFHGEESLLLGVADDVALGQCLLQLVNLSFGGVEV